MKAGTINSAGKKDIYSAQIREAQIAYVRIIVLIVDYL